MTSNVHSLLDEYISITKKWLLVRGSMNYTEAEEEGFLEALDQLWFAMSNEQRELANKQTYTNI